MYDGRKTRASHNRGNRTANGAGVLREVKRKLFGGEEVDATIKELENVFREKTGKEYEGRTEEEMK